MTGHNNTSLFLNTTASIPSELAPLSGLLFFIQTYCIIVIFTGVIGNVCVLIVFISRWKRLKTYEHFFISLAIADVIGTVVYPSYIILDVNKTQFKVDQCKTVFYLLAVTITVSSLKLIAVSVDRYIAIKWSQCSNTKRKRLCNIMIVMAWLVGAAFATVFLLRDAMVVWDGRCTMNANRTLEIIWSTVATHSLQAFIPIVVMIFLYSLIIYELHKTSNNCKAYMTPSDYRHRRLKNRKTTKLLLVVIIVFFICVTPKPLFYLFYMHNMFGMDRYRPSQLVFIISYAFTMLQMTNSCANPIIYSRLHTSFRCRIVSFVTSRFRIRELYKARASSLPLRINQKEEVDATLKYNNNKNLYRENSICRKLSVEVESTLRLLKESRYSRLCALRETVL